MFLLQQTINKTPQRHQVSLYYAPQNLYNDYAYASFYKVIKNNAVGTYNSGDMCDKSFSHVSSRHLNSPSSLHIIA